MTTMMMMKTILTTTMNDSAAPDPRQQARVRRWYQRPRRSVEVQHLLMGRQGLTHQVYPLGCHVQSLESQLPIQGSR